MTSPPFFRFPACTVAASLLAAVILTGNGSAGVRTTPAEPPDALIRSRIQEMLRGAPDSRIIVEGESVYSGMLVRSFYAARDFQPAWSEKEGMTQAGMLVRAVEEAYGDGLTPEFYHLKQIRSLLATTEEAHAPPPILLARLEILLTDAFITLGCHLSGGCVDPATTTAQWFAKRGTIDGAGILERAIAKRQVREELARLRPVQAAYANLRQVLAQYREKAGKGPWTVVSAGPLVKRGTVSPLVAELRRRLGESDDMNVGEVPDPLFDEGLEQAVTRFQKRHGLRPDGIVGPATRAALNVPLEARVRQIELNLERLRWILGNTEDRFIMVNIADFRLDVVESGRPVLGMKVVVGKTYQKTPVFTARMTYLVLNPSWNIPDSIARKEILHKIRKNPDYLAEHHITVLRGWGDPEEAVDPAAVDWARLSARALPFRFRQEPGPLNPLGRIKFMFPNQYDVYLHDTPSKHLFSEQVRTFSHGCTRLEKPIDLAVYLLQDDPDWTLDRIRAEIDTGVEKQVRLRRPLNVHFVYLTAWVDDQYELQFRNDVYGRDRLLDDALRGRPPHP